MSDDFTDENKKEKSFKQEVWDRSNATNENNTENKIIIQDNNNLQINYNISTNNEVTLNNKYDANHSSDNSLKAVKDIKTNPQKKNKKIIKKRRKKINLDEPLRHCMVFDRKKI
ncbi:hypothetical protein H312_00183 [Anncaliia algerae PRA339]|uniref:Uncharacterized protein n=1 Tax=Anncaliia algerae PRA339 TaxID=1288291 RepID=A0A059F5Q4_9MICR|nr:hypothetical protein H312_00183 [Anncaliia algerae PRA339]